MLKRRKNYYSMLNWRLSNFCEKDYSYKYLMNYYLKFKNIFLIWKKKLKIIMFKLIP